MDDMLTDFAGVHLGAQPGQGLTNHNGRGAGDTAACDEGGEGLRLASMR
ncbi:hypothetical protein JCM16814_05410 [Desulfobaculum senezii]